MPQTDEARILWDNRRISIQMEQWINSALSAWGLTATQAQVLLYILSHSASGTSLTDIHRAFGCSMPALSGILKRLKEKGFVRSEHWAGDDRKKLLFATPAAQELGQHLDRSSCQARRCLCSCFSPEELATLDRLQQKLLTNLSALNLQAKEDTLP